MASLHFQEWPTSADGGDDSEWYEWNEAALMVLHIRLYICEDSHACFRRIGRTHLGASTRLYMMLLLLPVVSLFSHGFSKHCLLSGHISRRRYLERILWRRGSYNYYLGDASDPSLFPVR